jgi:hypothetical protein
MSMSRHVIVQVNIGMHVASFCDGAAASQDVLADELLDLWNNPITFEGKTYYVMVSQILMDGPGRSKYCQCRGTTSLDGCNICDVKSRTFGQKPSYRTVYDSFRRYTPMNDQRRNKKARCNAGLQYVSDEKGSIPRRRKYADYFAAADTAEENVRKKNAPGASKADKKLPDHCDGVKGRYCFLRAIAANDFVLPHVTAFYCVLLTCILNFICRDGH